MPDPRRPGVLRRVLRALHRDVGYLLAGLTVVYAVSGLAVNHIGDFDPNFVHDEAHLVLGSDVPAAAGSDAARRSVEALVRERLGRKAPPRAVDWLSDTEAELLWDDGTAYVDLAAGTVDAAWQRPRFFLRAANFLHLNRGKAAWTFVADAYAVLLLFLAGSGLFMLPWRRGLVRRLVLVAAGAAIPAAYVILSDAAPSTTAANAVSR